MISGESGEVIVNPIVAAGEAKKITSDTIAVSYPKALLALKYINTDATLKQKTLTNRISKIVSPKSVAILIITAMTKGWSR